MAFWNLKAGKAVKLSSVRGRTLKGVEVEVAGSDVGSTDVSMDPIGFIGAVEHVIFLGRDGALYAQERSLAEEPPTGPTHGLGGDGETVA